MSGVGPLIHISTCRPRFLPTCRPIEARDSGTDRTMVTGDQKHGAQLGVPLSTLNNRSLGVFRGQAPGIALQLPMGTRIDAASDQ